MGRKAQIVDLKLKDVQEDSETIKRFKAERESRFDSSDVGHYVCLVFQTHKQSEAFVDYLKSNGIEVLYDRHANGEHFAELINVPIPQCNLKPLKNPFNKKLAEMVNPKALKAGALKTKAKRLLENRSSKKVTK